MDLDRVRLEDFPEAVDVSGLVLSDWNETEFVRALERYAGNFRYAQRRLQELGLNGWADPKLITLLNLEPAPSILVDYYRKQGVEPECSRTSAVTRSHIAIDLLSIQPREQWRNSPFLDTRFSESIAPRILDGMEVEGEIHIHKWYDRDGHAWRVNTVEGHTDFYMGSDRWEKLPAATDLYPSFDRNITSPQRRFEIMRLVFEFMKVSSESDEGSIFRNVRCVHLSDLAIKAIVKWGHSLHVKPTPSYWAAVKA